MRVFICVTLLLATIILPSTHRVSALAIPSSADVQKAAKSDREINIRIRVLTFNRTTFLSNLLKSLKNAEYGDDGVRQKVDLEISIDYSKNKGINDTVADIVEMFEWPFGRKVVIEHTQNVGVVGQWIEAWYPTNMNDYVFFVEDDIEVSPFFYHWIKAAVLAYDNPNDPRFKNIFGITLHKINKIPELKGSKGTLPIRDGKNLFAFPVLGTWGTVFFPEPWLRFRKWYRAKKHISGYQPKVNGIINTQWYMHSPSTVWSQWPIKWANDENMFCLYANFPNNSCLATNYRPPGNHFRHSHPRPDCDLIQILPPDMHLFDFPMNFTYYDYAALPMNPTNLTLPHKEDYVPQKKPVQKPVAKTRSRARVLKPKVRLQYQMLD